MAESGDRDDKTEAATPRRLQRARDEGQVPLSREAPVVAVLAAAALVVTAAAPDAAHRLAARLTRFLDVSKATDPGAALRAAMMDTLVATAPFALAAMFAGAAAILLQTGFLFNPGALRPDLGRIDPRRGLSRILGFSAVLEAGKALLKIAVAGWAGWTVLAATGDQLAASVDWAPATLLSRSTHQMVRIVLAMLAAQTAISAFDILRARLKHARDLRMSRQDLRDEHRESEGDPHIKGRQKQLRLQRARRRMLAAVPKATVVVTNPTHYAVALAYDRDKGGAPRVVAKGIDELALRIRQVARDAGVSVVANPPLARALYPIELDREIPQEHYKAVAEIIAYVWRLRTPRGRARR